MFNSIKKILGFSKPQRKKAKLPEGLQHLEVVTANGWWN
jgi:hypothetical protein